MKTKTVPVLLALIAIPGRGTETNVSKVLLRKPSRDEQKQYFTIVVATHITIPAESSPAEVVQMSNCAHMTIGRTQTANRHNSHSTNEAYLSSAQLSHFENW